MRRLCDRTDIVVAREVGGEVLEICAIGVAMYDEAGSELVVTLDSFVRLVNLRGPDREMRPDWLPRRDVIRHLISLDEGVRETGEIFRRWAEKVRRSVPSAEGMAASLVASRT